VTIKPPAGFDERPEDFEIKEGKLVARSRAKGEKQRKSDYQGLKLTQDEIARVKKAIKEGRL
jgi:hypothetical protein